MEKIKINFVNFWDEFDKEDNFITNVIKLKYEVELSEKPDYVFASVLGKNMDVLKYENAIRILFTGENIIPDFNIFDYAMGFCNLKFGDRYLRYPLYRLYNENWEKAQRKHMISREEFEKNTQDFVILFIQIRKMLCRREINY